ncbi:MAG: type II toxin-antitoxin system VapC family toxin [Chloroflexi bacterium]|nr:MAG: type II toxin-antitoxin system VapC family toxin [Chloroflexota bacterium]
MRPVVLDTDVFSFLFQRDTRAALYAPHLKDAKPFAAAW